MTIKTTMILPAALLLSMVSTVSPCLAMASETQTYQQVYRAYVTSEARIVEATCASGDQAVEVKCYGQNALVNPGEIERVVSIQATPTGCRANQMSPDQIIRIETQTTCAKTVL